MTKTFTEENVVVCFGSFMKLTDGVTGEFKGCINAEEFESAIADASNLAKAQPDWVQTWYDAETNEHRNAFIFEDVEKRNAFLAEILKDKTERVHLCLDDGTIAKGIAEKVQAEWDNEELQRKLFRDEWFATNREANSKIAIVHGSCVEGTKTFEPKQKEFLDGFIKFLSDKPKFAAVMGSDRDGGFWTGFKFENEVYKKAFVNKFMKAKNRPERMIVANEGELWQELVIKLDEYAKQQEDTDNKVVPPTVDDPSTEV